MKHSYASLVLVTLAWSAACLPAPAYSQQNTTLAPLSIAPSTNPVPVLVEPAPKVIPQTIVSTGNGNGNEHTTFLPNGPSVTQGDPFFEQLGTNGRSCFTCHRPGYGWGFSAGHAQRRFADTNGIDPLFRLVDGAVCPTDNVSGLAAMENAYRLLLNQGLIRIGLTFPANPQFTVAVSSDPDGCTGNPATGLTSPTSGTVNVYRRPLQTANLKFVTAIMWDGREPTLQHQSLNAALTHEQSATGPSATQQDAIVAFENGVLVAESSRADAGDLTAGGVSGGPVALSKQLFSPGINDPFGHNPTGAPFTPVIFSLYNAWASLTGTDAATLAKVSIARGQQVFNSKTFAITGVSGLNDTLGKPTIMGTCGTCHDAPNVGNASLPVFLNIGVTSANPPVLNVSQLPIFALTCTSGPLKGTVYTVSDPGRAMTTGNCTDIGKTKVPALRDLDPRPPYFHNGAARSLADVVNFYKKRFNFQLTPQEQSDLLNFLGAL